MDVKRTESIISLPNLLAYELDTSISKWLKFKVNDIGSEVVEFMQHTRIFYHPFYNISVVCDSKVTFYTAERTMGNPLYITGFGSINSPGIFAPVVTRFHTNGERLDYAYRLQGVLGQLCASAQNKKINNNLESSPRLVITLR